MESIYFVLSWVCHRSCRHCYEERFRPYHGEELERMVRQAAENVPLIIDHLPASMLYREHVTDREHVTEPRPPGSGPRTKTGRVILAGGEVLLDPVRETVLYPALERLRRKYEDRVELIVQTTGDTLTGRHVAELLERGVAVISCAGLDQYHAGFETGEARQRLREKLIALFEKHGLEEASAPARDPGKRYYHLFGATPDSWIGKLWPRGRAWQNSLSTAGIEDNFCNGWSGGLKFLDYGRAGAEVSIDPDGNVYPCCIKTKLPVGNLLADNLEAILDRARGNPVYEAISAGHPERMGLAHGWSVEKFLEKSTAVQPSGREYRNLCIGCDAFHRDVLMQPLVTIAPSA